MSGQQGFNAPQKGQQGFQRGTSGKAAPTMSVKVDAAGRTFQAETNLTSTDLRAAYMNFKDKTATRERRNRGIRTVAKTMAMTMGAVALAATLAACSAPAEKTNSLEADKGQSISEVGSGSAQLISRMDLAKDSETVDYVEQIDVIATRPGGAQVKVSCISTTLDDGYGQSGGITCDWANAVPVK